jgi:hypothetical protein
MEVKIKQGEEMLDATIEMVDGVMVVSPKEKFEPKDGDVVTYMNGDKPTIYVFAGGCKYNTSFYVAYSELRNEVFKISKGHLDRNRDDIRPATEEEKKKLFDKLSEEGYEFDFEKKKLVKLKWKPKEGEEFWFPLYYASPSEFKPIKSLLDKGRDKEILDKGWVFNTKEECQVFCNRLNDAINSIKTMNTDRHLKNELSELAAERNARKIKELRGGSTEKTIDWQQVRIQAAIAAMQGVLSNTDYVRSVEHITRNTEEFRERVSAISIGQADTLVKELKGE